MLSAGLNRLGSMFPCGQGVDMSHSNFGKFASEKDAMGWITAHPWLAEAPTEDPPKVVSRRW